MLHALDHAAYRRRINDDARAMTLVEAETLERRQRPFRTAGRAADLGDADALAAGRGRGFLGRPLRLGLLGHALLPRLGRRRGTFAQDLADLLAPPLRDRPRADRMGQRRE